MKFGVQVRGYLAQIGDVACELKDWNQVEQNPFFCPDPDKLEALDALMRALKKEGDSIGAKVTVIAENVPVGLGEPVFDRLDADLAHALMSINAVKGSKSAMASRWLTSAAASIVMRSAPAAFRATTLAAFSAASAAASR